MKYKVVSGIMLALLLTGMLTLAFDIQSVKASGTIYIRSDGSVDPPTADIGSLDNVTYYFLYNIYDEIVVERNNIIVDGDGYTLQGPGSGYGFNLTSINNVTIQNTIVIDFGYGVWLHESDYCTILENTVTNNYWGVALNWSTFNTIKENSIVDGRNGIGVVGPSAGLPGENYITGNYISNNWDDAVTLAGNNNTLFRNTIDGDPYGEHTLGIVLLLSFNNNISENTIRYHLKGIWVQYVANNFIYHNNFELNKYSVDPYMWIDEAPNFWDDGYPSGGNYYDDYDGKDLYKGVDQDQPGSDGIGDTPYIFALQNRDNYPLMNPYGSPPLPTYNLTITPTVNGTTNPAPGTYTYTKWSVVSVTAIPSVGYLLDYWELDGANVGAPNPISVTMETNHTLHPVFSWVGTYNLTITTTAGGTTSPLPGTHTCTNGTTVSVRAIPDTNYVFNRWELDASWIYSNPISVTMDTNHELHGVFVVGIPDIAITNVMPSKTVVCYSVSINVTVENQSDGLVTFNVTTYYDIYYDLSIETKTVNNLIPGEERTITFMWKTTGVAKGDYQISAYAWPVPGETDTGDNLRFDGTVRVNMVGDVNSDGQVTITDIVIIALAFGTKPGDPNWNPNADLNSDGRVTIMDIVIAALHFGEIDP